MKSILVYGGSSTGKTTLCGQFARYQYMRYGRRPCLYVGADSGPESAADEVAEGMLIPYNLATHPDPLWALRRIADGMWPRQINPVTGAAVNPQDFVDLRVLNLPISGLVVEGITRINENLSRSFTSDMQIQTGQPLVARFRLNGSGAILQGASLMTPETPQEESFSLPSQGTFNFIQQQTIDYVSRLKAHPYAPRLLVTAHQGEGKTSEGIAARCLGPMIYGRALVDKAPGWFSSYFHLETVPAHSFGQGSPEMRAIWFTHHLDRMGSGLWWPSKLGASARITGWFRHNNPTGFVLAYIDNNYQLQGGLTPFLEAFDSELQPRQIIDVGLRPLITS